MKRVLFLILFFASVSASAEMSDSIAVPEKRPFFKRLVEVVKEFSRIDTNYIEPQHYNFTAMLQNTNTYESYTLRNEQGQEIVLSPEPSIRIAIRACFSIYVIVYVCCSPSSATNYPAKERTTRG